MHAWRNWLHCTGSTYGAWLRGDPRGWRARHHREHVEGDYRDPPPEGAYDRLHAHSRRLMGRDAVLLGPKARRMACRIMAEALLYHGVGLIDLCVGAVHFHVLARFTPLSPGPEGPGLLVPAPAFVVLMREARRLLGIAKCRSARTLAEAGLAKRGGVWAVRCGVRPIEDRRHQLQVARYVRDHGAEGAAVWSLMRKGPI